MKDDCQGYEPWWEAANSDKKKKALQGRKY